MYLRRREILPTLTQEPPRDNAAEVPGSGLFHFETAGERDILGRWRDGSALQLRGFDGPLGSL